VRFAALVARKVVPLDEAALAIAQEEYPALDPAPVLETLDALAERVRDAAGPTPRAASLLRAVRTVLFTEERLRGNDDRYDDPRNSFLNDVLERKVGIPISLSVILMEVGRRAGIRLQGVGYPGHFLTRYAAPGGTEVYVDAFRGGTILSAEEVLEQLRPKDGTQLDRRHLAPVGEREILARMLRNLLNVSQATGDAVRSYWVVDRMLMLAPDAPALLRDRGLAAARLGANAAAVRDLEDYLERAPDAPDQDEVRDALEELHARGVLLN
jgi:regulator of sirC expression with transglutaminase-like and TPR domain